MNDTSGQHNTALHIIEQVVNDRTSYVSVF